MPWVISNGSLQKQFLHGGHAINVQALKIHVMSLVVGRGLLFHLGRMKSFKRWK